MLCYALGLWAHCMNWKLGSVWMPPPNYLLSFCKSKSLGILKLLRWQNWFAISTEKVVSPLFKLRTLELQRSFQFSVWTECIYKYQTSQSLAKSEFFNSLSTPTFAEKEKAWDKWWHFPICICLSFLHTDISISFTENSTMIFMVETSYQTKLAHNVLHWRSTGIHCWSCPANEIKLRAKITS